MQRLHPLRLSYELMSDANPLSCLIADAAGKLRTNRKPAGADNPFLKMPELFSEAIAGSLDQWRKLRDDAYERTFEAIYGSPWVQALAGLSAGDDRPLRPHPGVSPEHREHVARETEKLRAAMSEGGAIEAGLRSIGFVMRLRGEVDERGFNAARRLREVDCCRRLRLDDYKRRVRRQAQLMALDEEAAIAAIPRLLERSDSADRQAVAAIVEQAVTASAQPGPEERRRLQRVKALFAGAKAA